MKILVKEANEGKINEAIKAEEGRATARTITFNDVIGAASRITRRLDIPKKSMVGITAYVDVWAQDFPNAYKYTPESTQFVLRYFSTGWAVINIMRNTTHRASRAVSIELTETAKEEIIKNASVMASHEV